MSPLLRHRDDLLREIETAARKKDSAAVLKAARSLETVEGLIALAERPRPFRSKRGDLMRLLEQVSRSV